jgi:taurine dioxygenase
MKINKINKYIGAEVTGVKLNEPISKKIRKEIYNALLDNVALVIRDQKFSAEEFMKAVSLFGELMEDQNRRYLADGVPMVSVLSNRHVDSAGKPAKIANNATWHTDHTNQEYPPKFTALYPVALPDAGGGTALCNMREAYSALSDDWKIKIDRMKTANTLISSARAATGNLDIVKEQKEAGAPPMIHPLVRTHPECGTRSIWFHKAKTENIIGMEPQETQDFLSELLEEAIRPEFTYTHEYTLGDMLIIDNRSSMHKAGFDYDHSQHRMLYRALVRGDKPF